MIHLENKSILLISPSFFGYEKSIKQRLSEVSAKVDYFDERPANTFWSKALVRINRKLIYRRISQYYNSIYASIRNQVYDYVLVINVEAMPISFLEKVRERNSHAVFLLYMWDSISNKKNTMNYLSLFDRVFSFDPEDCRKYSNISFRPLFFLNEYAKLSHEQNYKYDFSFVGTAHSDRYALIQKIYIQIQNLGLKSYWYLYLQDMKLFYWNKITNSAFAKARLHDFQYNALSKNEVLDVVEKSQVIIDIQHPNQIGLTMRVIEILGARRKLVTTNASIKDYEFYLKENILVIDRENPIISKEFCYTSYQPLDDCVYHKYSLDGWLEDIFSVKSI